MLHIGPLNFMSNQGDLNEKKKLLAKPPSGQDKCLVVMLIQEKQSLMSVIQNLEN